ncbi:MAG: Uncharacterized protein XD80_0411 [Synergistales bacterium 53_16]|nr:MAG: Uncharacterized protein XD80_0411 [Synergistales bacterium 53_16]
MRLGRIIRAILVAGLVFCASPAAPQEPLLLLPAADRARGEALFVEAYEKVLQGKVRDAMKDLDEALKWDPYLVEYYLLKGYCGYLLGDYEGATKMLRHYLEVRPKDAFALGFLEQVENRMSMLEKVLSQGVDLYVSAGLTEHFQGSMGIPVFSVGRLRMPGRPSRIGDLLALCDNKREKAWLFGPSGEKGKRDLIYSGPAGGPVVRVLPVEKERVFFVYSDGSILMAYVSEKGVSERARVETGAESVSDAVYTAGDGLVLADRIKGEILFVDAETLRTRDRWYPETDGFEPVALAAFGPFLAVADRRNGVVRVLDLKTRRELESIALSGPVRAVEWMNSANLLALVEGGILYHLRPATGKPPETVAGMFPEAWFLFSSGHGVTVADTALYRSADVTGHADEGALVLVDPKPVDSDGAGRLELYARVIKPLGAERREEILFQGVLGGRPTEIRAELLPEETSNRTIDTLPLVPVEKPLWELEDLSGLSDVYVLDAAKAPEDISWLSRLGCFALSHGLTVNILAEKAIPSTMQVRLAELTGGNLFLSLSNARSFGTPVKWRLSVQVSDQVILPGEGGGGGLFIMGRSGSMTVVDRFPVWSVFSRPAQVQPAEGETAPEEEKVP